MSRYSFGHNRLALPCLIISHAALPCDPRNDVKKRPRLATHLAKQSRCGTLVPTGDSACNACGNTTLRKAWPIAVEVKQCEGLLAGTTLDI